MSSRSPQAKPDTAAQQALRKVGMSALTFGVCLMAVLITSTLALPWSLAGIAFGIATFVTGARALAAIRKAPQASSMQLLILVGLAMTAFMVVTLLLQAALYPTYSAYQTCQAQAVTDQAAAACDSQFSAALKGQFPGFAGLLQGR